MIAQEKTTTWPELTAILLARLGGLWLLVLVSFLLPTGDAAFYALMGVAFIITIPYSLWLRSKLRASQFAPLQFMVDLLLVTGLVYFTGGIHSDLVLLYPLVILSSGIVGTPRQAAEITVLAIITYALMTALLSNRMIVEYVPVDTALAMSSAGTALLLHILTFAIFGVASIYIAKQCSFINSREKELSETTASLLRSIPAPAFLLDRDGQVLFATQAACGLLGMDGEKLCAMKFSDLVADAKEPIPESYGTAAYLHREGESPLPVSYRSTDFQLQETALLDSKGRKNQEIKLSLLAITDISLPMETARQLQKIERITAATRIAGEMAHEIRTPLTVLSASIQLLRRYEEKATAADWLPNSPRRRDRTELFNHIDDASHRMDTVVKNFVDFAEFSPADLISIIKLDSIDENE
ncbi:MAG: histidine kinase dimerization/phospho-acceptor domain-containing protein, partial [Verrucomicrobiota bacterium]|nr:histidine kinase dimerization/phospho-acceptor domain-containing protein [Verrucomicrobiota bacterium]